MSRPGQLVDHAGTRTLARLARVRWSTPREFRHGPESPETSDLRRGHWNPGTGGLVYLVSPEGPGTRAQVAWDRWWTSWCLGHGCELCGSVV